MRFSSYSTDIRKIDIHDIDRENNTFRITTDYYSRASADDLSASIRNIGLLTPPVLLQKPGGSSSGGSYSIVCGFRRIAACRSLGWQAIDARVVIADSTDPALTLLSIADNTRTRHLNVVEQAIAAAKLSNYFKDPAVLCREAAKAGFTLNVGLFSKLLKINRVYDELKALLAADMIPLTIGIELGTFEKPDALFFSRLIEKLKPTLNHQKEIIRLVKEIARIKGCAIGDILCSDAMSAVLNDIDLDRNQKIRNLRVILRQMRYPEIVRFEKQFLDHVKRLNLPDAIRLMPPPDFEGGVFSLHARFTCLKEFNTVVQTMDSLLDHPDFARILEKNVEDH
jgi:ParB family chromosome partitioning protein